MKFQLGICQFQVGSVKAENLAKAATFIEAAAAQGARVIVLPEMFNSPYDLACFPTYAEEAAHSQTLAFLAQEARTKQCYLVGGSIPEQEGSALYNTCFVFDPQGRRLARYRKMHLFDIDLPGQISFQESAVLSPGNQIATFDTEFGTMGVVICYDLRFPEVFRLLVEAGVQVVLAPGAFNLTTGPAHWELLLRSRGLDNQVYLAGVSPARNEAASYVAYGHSLVVDPWGQILWQAAHQEAVGCVTIDLERLTEIRTNLPALKHRRRDLY